MTHSDIQVITAPDGELRWIYEIPPRTDAKVQLLTIGRTATHGNWYGAYGENFIAYCPMPKRNKRLEDQLIASGTITP